ncbi:hypothetical protein [Singulisphaera sp. PoT]|uniref:hypothetical protein n=1 Tax=Singulisphaera sp. PoT TaxID=3411797 RepID=UPI003BF55591
MSKNAFLNRLCRVIPAGSVLLLALVFSGCGVGGQPMSPPVDPDKGRNVLREVLDAWKDGKPYETFTAQGASTRVADEDWLEGQTLVAFEVDTKDQLIGDVLRCPVSLSLKDKGGKGSKKRVYYNVTTAPTPSVIRQD